jgi:sugar transferase (PEP-CTERM/EpsH1 system associated)
VRILFLCHRIPYPPDKGDKIRAFHHLQAMAEHHEVDLYTLVDDPRDRNCGEALARYCQRLTVRHLNPKLARLRSLPYLFTKMPLTIPCFYSSELALEVRKGLASRSYDRIFVYCSSMAQYLDPARSIPTIVDLVDMDSDKWKQYAAWTKFPISAVYRREGRTLEAHERSVCGRACCVLVSTEREAQLARQIAPPGRVHVLSNGVNTEYFKRDSALPPPAVPAVIFTGDMSYLPNEDAVVFFATRVYPLIRQQIGDIRFLIVGRNPGRRVQELSRISGVEVTGFVPDVRIWLAKAQVAVAPFRIAAGIQNKILEAMAFGLPVVATPRAVQGLYGRIAELVDTGDTPEELSSQIVVLLRNFELARSKGMDGRCGVIEDYRWDHTAERLLQLLEAPIAS